MIDWSQPQPLSRVTEGAGFTMSDVAFVSGLDESTISRLWDDPRWLDRVSGRSLQSLAASVPGVAEYFASHSVLARRDELVKQLEAEGLVVNRSALLLSASTDVPHQYLINALEAALSIIRSDTRRACSYLARFWGAQQNRALESLYAVKGDQALLQNPDKLLTASTEMAPRISRKGYSFHAILALSSLAHHVAIVAGKLDNQFLPPITDRQSAFMVRSGIMGLLINSADSDLAQQYEKMVNETPILAIMEEWSFPTYTRDCKPNADFSLPGSILLRRTADEILREIGHYSEAYLYYLCRTYLPLALNMDPIFGLKLTELGNALAARADVCEDATVRRACVDLARRTKEIA